MMRALFAGVSGLRNHQTQMDVIGNNIANVNTVAFKGSRVTFEEAFTQLIRGASRAPGDLGGTNPMQVGLGMNVGSIDQNFSQGNLESTGINTDLAIQGDAFFIASNGPGLFYTRAGSFQLDAEGHLVVPTNGYRVQGVMADDAGVLPTGATLEDIILPIGRKSPARATTEITLKGNLDSREEPLGTILRTAGDVFAIERASSNGGAGSDIQGLYAHGAAEGQILGMSPDRSTVTIGDGTTTQTYTYVSADAGAGDGTFNSLNGLIAEINADFAGQMTASLNTTTGSLDLTANAAGVAVTVTSSNAALQTALSTLDGALANGATVSSDEFSHVAAATDLLVDLRNSAGLSMGITDGDTVLLDGNVGGTAVSQGSLAVTGASTTYQDLVTLVNGSFGMTNATATEIDTGSGGLRITGDGGAANALSGVNIRVQGGTAPTFDAVFGSGAGNYIEEQSASDVQHDMAITVFDALGERHVLSLTFTKDPSVSNRWTWAANVPSPALATSGASGAVTFDDYGRLETFTYDGGAAAMTFDPNPGSSVPVEIAIDAGIVGEMDGLSQFAAPANAVATSQDGYSMGNLQEFAIDETGMITGFFTNGVDLTLGRIAVASFANPTGLLRHGDNMYAESANSGDALVGFVGTTNQSTITPGAVEGSNVDLSQEFTNMIIAQRGFQANARVITTADEMLTELVNLKR